MCKNPDELVAIIDEVAGAAVSMQQGAHNYDIFIKARDLAIHKIHEHFRQREKLAAAIADLHKLI